VSATSASSVPVFGSSDTLTMRMRGRAVPALGPHRAGRSATQRGGGLSAREVVDEEPSFHERMLARGVPSSSQPKVPMPNGLVASATRSTSGSRTGGCRAAPVAGTSHPASEISLPRARSSSVGVAARLVDLQGHLARLERSRRDCPSGHGGAVKRAVASSHRRSVCARRSSSCHALVAALKSVPSLATSGSSSSARARRRRWR
jgi:hypothetical protein